MSAAVEDAMHRVIKAVVKLGSKDHALFVVRLYVLQDDSGVYWADIDRLRMDVFSKIPVRARGITTDQLEIFADAESQSPIRNAEELIGFLRGTKDPSGKLKLYFVAPLLEPEPQITPAPVQEPVSQPLPSYLDEKKEPIEQPLVDSGEDQKKQLQLLSKSLQDVTKERDQCLVLVKMLQTQLEKLEGDIRVLKKSPQLPTESKRDDFDQILSSKLSPLLDRMNSLEKVHFKLLESNNEQVIWIQRLLEANSKAAENQQWLVDEISQHMERMEQRLSAVDALPSKLVVEMRRVMEDQVATISQSIAKHIELSKPTICLEAPKPIKTSASQSPAGATSLTSSTLLESKSDAEVPPLVDNHEDEEEDLSVEGWRVVPIPDPTEESRKLHKSLTESQMLYTEELAKLESLGHSSRSLNAMLLQIHNGDVNRVLEKLEELRKHHVA